MPIEGRFDSAGRPFITGELLLPDQGVRASLSFLVDTGTDRTLLLPAATARLAIDFARLAIAPHRMGGIGGSVRYAHAAARLVFYGSRMYAYRLTIAVAEPGPQPSPVEALLGRDILDRWYLRYESRSRLLRAENVSADEVFPLPDDE